MATTTTQPTPTIGRLPGYLAALGTIVVAAAVFAAVVLTSTPDAATSATPVTPTLEHLKELAAIYEGQTFGWDPTPTVDLQHLEELAAIYEGQTFGWDPAGR